MYNEIDNVEPMLARVHEGLQGYGGDWELICVDDGSRDGTGERLMETAGRYGSHVRTIRLRRNFGQTAAMQAGFDAARGTLIATLDGDLQNDPADIPRMVDELIERDLDLLQGWRHKRQDDLVMRKIPSRIANRLIGKVTGVALHDYGCSLKVYRAEVIRELTLLGEMHRFIPVWVAGVTAPSRIGETPVAHRARQFGTSKYGISRTFRVLLDLLSAFFFLRFGSRPGHFFGSIGIVFGVIGSLTMAYLLMVKFGLGQNIGQRPLLVRLHPVPGDLGPIPDHWGALRAHDPDLLRLQRAHPPPYPHPDGPGLCGLEAARVTTRSDRPASGPARGLAALLASPWMLAAVLALSFFWQLGAVPLYDLDEGAFTEATREMVASGNYITPHKDGQPRYDKPALIYWLQAASAQTFGLGEWSLRLPSALAASLWVLAAVAFVRERLDPPTAILAGMVMALSLQVSLIAKAAVADALLNLFIALAFFEIYRFYARPEAGSRSGPVLRAYLWMGLGFLTKGPVAVFFPMVASLLFFWSQGALGRWRQAVLSPLGWLVFLLVAGPWYLAIYLDDGAGFFQSFFLKHNAGRFGEAMHGHSGFLGYYFAVLPLIVLPFTGWLLRLLPDLPRAWADPLDRFLWIWFLIGLRLLFILRHQAAPLSALRLHPALYPDGQAPGPAAGAMARLGPARTLLSAPAVAALGHRARRVRDPQGPRAGHAGGRPGTPGLGLSGLGGARRTGAPGARTLARTGPVATPGPGGADPGPGGLRGAGAPGHGGHAGPGEGSGAPGPPVGPAHGGVPHLHAELQRLPRRHHPGPHPAARGAGVPPGGQARAARPGASGPGAGAGLPARPGRPGAGRGAGAAHLRHRARRTVDAHRPERDPTPARPPMSEGALAFLRRDLGMALAAGALRTPLEPPGGGLWLARATLGCLIVGTTLFLFCGYHAGFERLNAAAAAYPDWVWEWLTALGDERVPLALSLFFARRRPRVFWTLVLAALLAIAYSRGLKHLFDTLRPPAVLAADAFHLIGPGPRRTSFPSGHSTSAGVFFGVLVYYARWWETRALLLLIALLVGLSRVAVGVHWPVDVAFGLGGGLAAAWAGARLAARWPGPATSPGLHLALAGLAAWSASLLIFSDRGYTLARPLFTSLGAAALAYALLVYVVLPLHAHRRGRGHEPEAGGV